METIFLFLLDNEGSLEILGNDESKLFFFFFILIYISYADVCFLQHFSLVGTSLLLKQII